jgi:hypothetical protein
LTKQHPTARRTPSETSRDPTPRAKSARVLTAIFFVSMAAGGCATIRTTDPPRTATEQFLLSTATSLAIEQLSVDALRDRVVYVDTTYLTAAIQPPQEYSFAIGELRAKLLEGGVRLTNKRDTAQIVLEARSGGIGIDRLEFLLGIPSTAVPGFSSVASGAPVAIPELALLKTTKQRGFASVAFVAYWSESGEVVATSGPFIGRTLREDFWIFGTGPRTVGNIAPVDKVR